MDKFAWRHIIGPPTVNVCALHPQLRLVTLEAKLNWMQNMHQITLHDVTFRSAIHVSFLSDFFRGCPYFWVQIDGSLAYIWRFKSGGCNTCFHFSKNFLGLKRFFRKKEVTQFLTKTLEKNTNALFDVTNRLPAPLLSNRKFCICSEFAWGGPVEKYLWRRKAINSECFEGYNKKEIKWFDWKVKLWFKRSCLPIAFGKHFSSRVTSRLFFEQMQANGFTKKRRNVFLKFGISSYQSAWRKRSLPKPLFQRGMTSQQTRWGWKRN